MNEISGKHVTDFAVNSARQVRVLVTLSHKILYTFTHRNGMFQQDLICIVTFLRRRYYMQFLSSLLHSALVPRSFSAQGFGDTDRGACWQARIETNNPCCLEIFHCII